PKRVPVDPESVIRSIAFQRSEVTVRPRVFIKDVKQFVQHPQGFSGAPPFVFRILYSSRWNLFQVSSSPIRIQHLKLVEKSRDQVLLTHGAMDHSSQANLGHNVLPPLDFLLALTW